MAVHIARETGLSGGLRSDEARRGRELAAPEPGTSRPQRLGPPPHPSPLSPRGCLWGPAAACSAGPGLPPAPASGAGCQVVKPELPSVGPSQRGVLFPVTACDPRGSLGTGTWDHGALPVTGPRGRLHPRGPCRAQARPRSRLEAVTGPGCGAPADDGLGRSVRAPGGAVAGGTRVRGWGWTQGQEPSLPPSLPQPSAATWPAWHRQTRRRTGTPGGRETAPGWEAGLQVPLGDTAVRRQALGGGKVAPAAGPHRRVSAPDSSPGPGRCAAGPGGHSQPSPHSKLSRATSPSAVWASAGLCVRAAAPTVPRAHSPKPQPGGPGAGLGRREGRGSADGRWRGAGGTTRLAGEARPPGAKWAWLQAASWHQSQRGWVGVGRLPGVAVRPRGNRRGRPPRPPLGGRPCAEHPPPSCLPPAPRALAFPEPPSILAHSRYFINLVNVPHGGSRVPG